MVEWKIINSVFNINFNVPLSLDKVAGELAEYEDINIKYEPRTFPAIILYLNLDNKTKKIKILIFNNGFINIAGLKDIENINEIINKLKEILKRINIELSNNYELKATNIVINGKFDYTDIDIEKIYNDFGKTQDMIQKDFPRFLSHIIYQKIIK